MKAEIITSGTELLLGEGEEGPVLLSREYFAPWIFRFTVERKA